MEYIIVCIGIEFFIFLILQKQDTGYCIFVFLQVKQKQNR